MATNKVRHLVERLFVSLPEIGQVGKEEAVWSDVFVRITPKTGELALYDSEQELLASIVIYAWIDENRSEPTNEMISVVQEVIASLEGKRFWDAPCFERPFSIVLVSEELEHLEDLLFINDEDALLTTPLLEGLDEDLENFIQNILGDLK